MVESKHFYRINFAVCSPVPVEALVNIGKLGVTRRGIGHMTVLGADARHTNDHTAWPKMPESCVVEGFTDWFKVGNYCVKYFNTLLNFTDAELSCIKNVSGGHLVSVHSGEDNNHLVRIVKKYNPKDLRIWIGGFRLLRTHTFFWLDGSVWDYDFWKSGEPNHNYTQEECTEMNWECIGRWNDDSCFVEKNYMCAFKRNNASEVDLK